MLFYKFLRSPSGSYQSLRCYSSSAYIVGKLTVDFLSGIIKLSPRALGSHKNSLLVVLMQFCVLALAVISCICLHIELDYSRAIPKSCIITSSAATNFLCHMPWKFMLWKFTSRYEHMSSQGMFLMLSCQWQNANTNFWHKHNVT